MATVTSTSAAALENPCGSPQPTSTGARSSERVAPPNAAERKPASVTPTWTADRKRFGSSLSSATIRPRRLCPANVRTWLSRKDTRAISAAAKTPPMRTNRMTSPTLASVLFTDCDLGPWTRGYAFARRPGNRQGSAMTFTMRFPRDVPTLTDGVVTLRAHTADDVEALYEQAVDSLM